VMQACDGGAHGPTGRIAAIPGRMGGKLNYGALRSQCLARCGSRRSAEPSRMSRLVKQMTHDPVMAGRAEDSSGDGFRDHFGYV